MGKSLTLSEQEAGQRATPSKGERLEVSGKEEGMGETIRPPTKAGGQTADSGRRGCCCFEVLSCFVKAKGLPGLGKYYIGL